MVTTASHFSDSRYRTYAGEGFDGVVRVSYGGYYGTGAVLFDGRAILTTAHLFDGRSGTLSVSFETRAGTQTVSELKYVRHLGYDSEGNNDIAIVWLASAAPIEADRYGLYRDRDEVGQAFTLAGYGRTGTGATGATSSESATPPRLKAANLFDTEASDLETQLGSFIGWKPLAGTQLLADFDNGLSTNDALGQLLGRTHLGYGANEGLIASGDSGGPAFIDGLLAGVATYTASLSRGTTAPDIDSLNNSSFGEIGAWQRVSAYQQWIDQSLRAEYTDAPTRPQDVVKEVAEGHAGTRLVYFLLQFTGVRNTPEEIVGVDYATRDGSALAGSDYIAAQGTLNLYPGEDQAVIAVEILGDATPEPDETFYLDVFNPVGGSFGVGVVKLTAVRTLLDDDGWLG